jgi:hypothetical protein
LSIVYFRITAPRTAPRSRARLLERLLARGDAALPVAGDWRSDALRLIVPAQSEVPAVAVAAFRASRMPSRAAWVAVATPVHLLAGMRSVGLPEDGILALEPSHAAALARNFNDLFTDGGVRLAVAGGNVLLCLFEESLRVVLCPPDGARGEDIGEYLPSGADGARVRRLMSEMEMWLFDNPVNLQRRKESLAAVSGLWLWGGGPTDTPLVSLDGWAAGDDLLCVSLKREARYPGAESSGVVAIASSPGSAGWAEAEELWLAPAVDDLRAGRLEAIELSVGRRRVRAPSRGRWRFWRRTRPWWEALVDDG